jgi:hypothetical protein
MNLKIQHVILVVIVFIGILLLQRGCYQKEISKLENEISISKLDNQALEKKVNEKGDTIAYQTAIIVDNEKALNDYTDSIFELKKKVKETLAYSKEVVKVKVPPVYIPYTDSVPYPEYITDTFARKHMVIVPRDFEADSLHYSIAGTVQKDGVQIKSIELIDTTYGRFVEPKPKLFKRQQIEYQVMHTNPYLKTVEMSSAIYKPKKKPLLQRLGEGAILVGIGAIIGIAIK